MNYCEPINIKHKNAINNLGNILIKVRNAIIASNDNLQLSAIQQLRVILFCCLYVQKYDGEFTKEKTGIEKVCEFFEKNSDGQKDWFYDYLQIEPTKINLIDVSNALHILENNYDADTFTFLIPYALEILEYSDVELGFATKDRRNGVITAKKKKNGIYYTPSDVVMYMVNLCIKNLQKSIPKEDLFSLKFVDLSCGSGVFLEQLLRSLAQKLEISDINEYTKIIKSSIFGIDISEYAVENTRFLLISNIISRFPKAHMDYAQILKVLNENIICADAINIKKFYSNNPHFPKKFHCVIGNPPYVEMEKSGICKDLKKTGRSNLFIPFVHNVMDITEEKSVSALIVPLSISYNTNISYCELRSRIQQDDAKWISSIMIEVQIRFLVMM